jgi:uncharacterized membrane protein
MLMALAVINLFLSVFFIKLAYRYPGRPRVVWSVGAVIALIQAVVYFIRSIGA